MTEIYANSHENFLIESGNTPLYRGFFRQSPESEIFISSPKNKEPRDTPREVHLEMDEWFFENFGLRFRSQAIFATGSHFAALYYGQVRTLKPLEEYYFCWSKNSSDLFHTFQAKPANESITNMMERLEFQCTDLKSAINSKNEIMIICKNMIATLLEE
jgi:hypothetical protein